MMALAFDEDTHTYRVDGRPVPGVTEICSHLTPCGFDASNAVLAQAVRRGTRVHELTELVDYGALPDEIEPELVGYLRAYLSFLRDYRPVWLHIEHRMADGANGFAGTADRIGLISGALTVVDLKTNSGFTRGEKIRLAVQLEGYARLFASCCETPVVRRLGLRLLRDGKYTVYDADKIARKYDFFPADLFDSLLEITKLMGGYR